MWAVLYYLTSMRPKQFIKNFFVFVGIVFSGNLLNISMLAKVTVGFLVFCLISGAVYLINDIVDIDKDRNHPRKKNRPLAAGMITVRGAATVAVLVSAAALYSAFALSSALGIITTAYFALMILYSFYLKNIIILDVFTIATGFVLRVVAGTEVIDIYLSPWAVMCTFFLALFLALGKRRSEKIVLGGNANSHRVSLDSYPLPLLDQMISIVTTSTIVSYFLYTFKYGQSLSSFLSVPFVLFGLFRYLYLVYADNSGGSPEEIVIKDRPLQISLALWMGAAFINLY
ncbi:MAG: phosphoribose diphosphate:decaprenyl-phosphate phosphoribosyltransferase [Peptococcaceae bacterium BICA1-7]|nr:MAG: phosphoribose diphosphate:decaprenyl-phosphate phosphoribosyltransferase [Peptococcaceae bacterium BICA1-7]